MAFYVPESYADGSPYPELKVQGANREYARMMLFNMSGRESEMTAANSYFYASLVLVSSEPQAAACLGKIGEVEMRHVYMLGRLACLLGADPRLWWKNGQKMHYWNPGNVVYTRDPQAAIRWAISREKDTIVQYRKQITYIQDPYICAVLERILLDESHHVLILEKMGRSLREGETFQEKRPSGAPVSPNGRYTGNPQRPPWGK